MSNGYLCYILCCRGKSSDIIWQQRRHITATGCDSKFAVYVYLTLHMTLEEYVCAGVRSKKNIRGTKAFPLPVEHMFFCSIIFKSAIKASVITSVYYLYTHSCFRRAVMVWSQLVADMKREASSTLDESVTGPTHKQTLTRVCTCVQF